MQPDHRPRAVCTGGRKAQAPGLSGNKIGSQLDEGWRFCSTDGMGRGTLTAAAIYAEDRRGREDPEGYLGPNSGVVGAE